jgi:hypothetical protein
MCEGVKDTTHKIVPASKSEPGLGYRGMAYTDPIARRMIERDTNLFCYEMRREAEEGRQRRLRDVGSGET